MVVNKLLAHTFSNFCMFNLENVQFSRNDIRRGIFLPKKLSPLLAEDIGFHLGDGYLGDYSTEANPHKYEISYSGHKIYDYPYYIETLFKRKLELFGICPKLFVSKTQNSIIAKNLSKAIVFFYRDVIGISCGNKINACVPPMIKNSSRNIKISFIRGLFDADSCLTFKKKHKNVNYYPCIELTSINDDIFNTIKSFLLEFGFTFTTSIKSPEKYKRLKYLQHCIDINGKTNLDRWMRLIGFNNQKQLFKYSLWKKNGFCPPENVIEKIWWARRDLNSWHSPCKGDVCHRF